ncbi:MAG: hypothetical protein U0Q18_27890 [Bryobacteraceae bacterium]
MRAMVLALLLALDCAAQVYSPKVLKTGQPDASDLRLLAQGIYANAGAQTQRQKAEAIWRFFLTDGRFVEPGFWYHIAGWAYEEPTGEVLDPVKLLNSYGYGLCYQIAPVLEAVWKAGGFADARVWFLTGHTVAEVFYDGAYHYYDSDMMGYNTVGRGAAKESRVASVHEIEQDGNIMLGKLKNPTEVDPSVVEAPWYPADVREAAIDGLAELFTTTNDNRLFPFERAPQSHTMNFVLRPGERLVRNFAPEGGSLYYLPYKFTGDDWKEFPQEFDQYQIRTADGPHSHTDARRWATGALEYRLPVTGENSKVYDVRSPYVIVDAQFQFDAVMTSERQSIKVETSTDDGRTWTVAGRLNGPHRGYWQGEPAVLTRSAHGRRTAISGSYAYLLRVTKDSATELRSGQLRTRIQLNPRTLPALTAGRNELIYSAGPAVVRRTIAPDTSGAKNARFVSDGAQGYWEPAASGPAEFVFHLTGSLDAFTTGARFLDLSSGLAPDKFTAEVRKITPLPSDHAAASIAWSHSPAGPFHTIWEYDPRLKWKDNDSIDRILPWPEVDRRVDTVGAHDVYIRYRVQDLAVDSFRLAAETKQPPSSTPLEVTHTWKEDGIARSKTEHIPAGAGEYRYVIEIPPDKKVENEAVIFGL